MHSPGAAASGYRTDGRSVAASESAVIRRLRFRICQDRDLLRSLLWMCVVLGLATAFALLGSEVAEGDTQALDVSLLLAAQDMRLMHPRLSGAMRDLSAMGSTTVLTLVTVSAVGYLALVGAWSKASLMAASTLSGSVLVWVLKWEYGRARPGPDHADLIVSGLSFPSGHATSSAVVYLSLGALFASTRTRVQERTYIFFTVAGMAGQVGVSRVALGVHWATDVLGGWTIGAAWALMWLLISRAAARGLGSDQG